MVSPDPDYTLINGNQFINTLHPHAPDVMKKEREEYTLSCMIVLSDMLSKRNAQTDTHYLYVMSLNMQSSHIKSATGTTQFNHINTQNTLKDITSLFQREQLLSNHAAVFLWNGEKTHIYTQSYTL